MIAKQQVVLEESNNNGAKKKRATARAVTVVPGQLLRAHAQPASALPQSLAVLVLNFTSSDRN